MASGSIGSLRGEPQPAPSQGLLPFGVGIPKQVVMSGDQLVNRQNRVLLLSASLGSSMGLCPSA